MQSKVEKNRGRVYYSVGASAWPEKTGISTGAKNRETTGSFVYLQEYV